MFKPVALSAIHTSSRGSSHYPKGVQNSKAMHRRSTLMSLGSLVMQIWCNAWAVALQGCSQGTFLWKEPEKSTGPWLLRGQSCFFHHQHESLQGFRSLKFPLVKHIKLFQYYSEDAIFICKWLLSALQQTQAQAKIFCIKEHRLDRMSRTFSFNPFSLIVLQKLFHIVSFTEIYGNLYGSFI